MKTWVMWNWQKDLDAPRSWEPGEHVVLAKIKVRDPLGASDDSMSKLADRALLRFADQGGVVVIVYDLKGLRLRAQDTFHPRIIPALAVEKPSDLTLEVEQLFASMTAKHRALLVTPREHIDLDPPTCPTCGSHEHSDAALEETDMFFCKEHDEEMTFGALLDPCAGENRHGVDLVVVRGTAGKEAWPLRPEWLRDMRDACAENGVAFAFLGWGDYGPRTAAVALEDPNCDLGPTIRLGEDDMQRLGKDRTGRLLDDIEHVALPEDLRPKAAT